MEPSENAELPLQEQEPPPKPDRTINVTGNEEEEKALLESKPIVVQQLVDKTRGMLVGFFFAAHKEDAENGVVYKQFLFPCNVCRGTTAYYRYPCDTYPSDLLCLTTDCLERMVRQQMENYDLTLAEDQQEPAGTAQSFSWWNKGGWKKQQ